MSPRVGVVTFPGSLDDSDTLRAVMAAGAEPVSLWHGDPSIGDVAAVVVPGGFSYGDYLRCGAIARFAPIMSAVVAGARDGLPVLGICNGFQILCESGLLPGVLTRNESLHYVCKDQSLAVGNTDSAWTRGYTADQVIVLPVKHGEGRYVADEHTLDMLAAEGRVAFTYRNTNPNGSFRDIAGITNEAGNVLGLMPHPEHAIETLVGTPGADGLTIFESAVSSLVASV